MTKVNKGKEYEDYTNPILWAIILVGLAIGLVITLVIQVRLSVVPVGAFSMFIIWVALWESYKRTIAFKKRYSYPSKGTKSK